MAGTEAPAAKVTEEGDLRSGSTVSFGYIDRTGPLLLDTNSLAAPARKSSDTGGRIAATNRPGVRRGAESSPETCKIWRKFDGCGPIGYRLLVRIASNSPIQAQIRIGHALTRTKI